MHLLFYRVLGLSDVAGNKVNALSKSATIPADRLSLIRGAVLYTDMLGIMKGVITKE